jgi:uncharacterized membrane protein (UPF0182 family)
MRDLFDEFLEEIRRREAAARGEDPDAAAAKRARKVSPDDGPDGPDDDGDRDDDDRDAERGPAEDPPRERVPPRPIRVDGDGGGGGRHLGWWIAGGVLLSLILLLGVGLDLWTDVLWFQSVGFDGVFWTRLTAQLGLFAVTTILALVILLGNLWLAGRMMPRPTDGGGSFRDLFERLNEAAQQADGRNSGRWNQPEARRVSFGTDDIPDLTPVATIALVAVSVLAALTIGGSVAAAWETVLLWANRVPYSPDLASTVADPVFGRDISYFLFELPFLRFVQALFNGIVVAALLVVFARYLVGATRGSLVFTTPVRVHLAVLGGLFLLSVAFGYQLDKYELVYSTRGLASGVSFTDQNAQFFAYDVLTILSGLAAALLVGGAFTRMLWPLGLVVAVWFVASIGVGRLYPEAIQRFTVQPNQYAQEERYIGNNIAMTRQAFGLDAWEIRSFGGEDVLTAEAIENEVDTFTNARLWDYRPLGDTLDQLQVVRRYYDFYDVDTDRYIIDDTQRQVMLSGRELAPDQNPGATGFVNRRIVFTHGIGVAMVPVNEVANEGQPRLFIRNLPPVSDPGAPQITEPRIYFGERPNDWVVTGARQNEFDFPTGESESDTDAGTETRWTGTTGIKLDTTLARLLFALRFRDLDLLISDQVTADSQLLMHRYLSDRLPRIAPFLAYDKDPYLVIDDAGRLVYIQDAYTVSDRFPHAQPFDPSDLGATSGLGGAPINYVRNSVKITMDAYDGTMRFYVADEADPIIRAYQGVFPTLFQSMDQLPEGLRAHIRYPEELFNVQTRVLGRYHMTNPLRFFQNDDLWTVPTGATNEQSLPSEAYYVVMRMPGESKAEFLLLQPMIPINRPNMIAWVAARNDGDAYGTTRVYRFPAETTIFGPAQIEARIDQDPIISEQFTLWRNSGSDVIRGNLIVVPVGDSLLYLQPIYLQSTGSAFPEFRRIVVASPRQVVWGTTLAEALRLLLESEGSPVPPSPTPGPTPDPGASPGASPTATPSATPTPDPADPLPDDVAGLIDYANRHFELAQQALQAGDFARYGEEIALVEAALQRLETLAPGLIAPSPGASVSPAP